MFDRRLSRANDWAANGELICVRNGANLTINGNKGSDDTWRPYETKVYFSNASDNKAEKNGGGIYTTNEVIKLSDLTIRNNTAVADRPQVS